MKKHTTVPNQPEEMPLVPEHPEIKRPTDPKEPEPPQRELEELPGELPPNPGKTKNY